MKTLKSLNVPMGLPSAMAFGFFVAVVVTRLTFIVAPPPAAIELYVTQHSGIVGAICAAIGFFCRRRAARFSPFDRITSARLELWIHALRQGDVVSQLELESKISEDA